MITEKELIIAGAGASGLMSGIMAAKQGCSCLFLEHEAFAGKKLLATGNGRCNFTNENQDISFYHSNNPDFVKKVLSSFTKSGLLLFFKELGIKTWEKDGYYYPYSGQASTVKDILVLENQRLGNVFSFNEHVSEIYIEEENRIRIKTEKNEYRCRCLIIAAGAKAQKGLGSDGSFAEILKKLGYELSPFFPALVPLIWDFPYSGMLAGIRAKGKIILMSDKSPVAEDCGELQFTDYGISGIPVFQVSRYFSLHKNGNISAVIDFFPNTDADELTAELLADMERYNGEKCTIGDMVRLLHGFGNEKLILTFILKYLSDINMAKKHEGKLRGSKLIKSIMESPDIFTWDLNSLSKSLSKDLKEMKAGITGTRGFDFAQVCTGGIELSQISSETMESKKHKGIYITGELLNVDACCGGYNLQWAFSTGYIAGKAAGKNAKN